MTAAQLIKQLQELIAHGMPDTVEIRVWDDETADTVPVTCFLYDDKTLEMCIDAD